jgi:uncharacterized protein (DUF1697 family)
LAKTAPPAKSSAGCYVALLRGLSLGGKQIAMKDLVAIFADAGCRHARHYIRSGNVVFSAPPSLAARMPALVMRVIEERFGFESPVVLRTADAMHAVAKRHPLDTGGLPHTALHVGFMAEAPPEDRVALLDPARSPPDAFLVQGREIYLRLPNGGARSKLTSAYFDSKLGTISTFRNWRTVVTLAEMTDAPQPH